MIKFKAYDKEDHKIYKVAHMANLLTVGEYITVRKNEDDAVMKIERALHEGSYILMQYSGLNDSNGVEIYDGYVIYLAGYGDYVVEFPYIQLYESAAENDIGDIKGNIYENPELLEL